MPRTWRSSAPREIGDRGRQEEIMSGDQRCQGTIFYVYVDKYCYFFASTELQDSTLGILKSGPTVASRDCDRKTRFVDSSVWRLVHA